MTFQDRTAVVTGGTRGIGRAICRELARQGCNVAFNYVRSAAQAEELTDELLESGRKVRSFKVDVSDYGSVELMVRKVREEFGGIDYLVNNAGIVRDGLILRMTEQDWDEVIAANLKGAFNISKAAIGAMMKARFGSIVNITSVSGLVGMAGQANYSASKAGLIGLTKALAKEMASRNITVNAVALGFIDTDMIRSLREEYRARILASIPLGRLGAAEEIARVVSFLLSDDARYITGQVIQVDGGLAM